MKLLLDDRGAAEVALYIDGNLQFDSRDEALYHESLALPAMSLTPNAKRVLICGGGDGLALREVLRFSCIEHVDLVDYSAEVIELGVGRFREINQHAFQDPRVSVHVADAWDFLPASDTYDSIICDFTFPSTPVDARLFSVEWFQLLHSHLAREGCVAINGVSPQATPDAFAVLVRTIRAAGFSTLPYRVCIPSFREHGYGAWGFVLASCRHLTIHDLQTVACPVETRQADLSALARGAHFSRAERKGFRNAPIARLDNQAILDALNHRTEAVAWEPPSVDGLMANLPLGHAYHTAEMLEALASSVIGTVRSIDLRRILDELIKRAERLPKALVEEIARIRECLRDRLFDAGSWDEWASRLFAALIIVMIIANAVSPDNAFGKGAHGGIGHASISRGTGSFGHEGGSFHSTSGEAEAHALSGTGFRGGSFSSSSAPVDVYGHSYRPRVFYYHSYYGTSGGYGPGGYSTASGNGRRPADTSGHKPLFVADDDMMVMDNGDVVVTLTDNYYLLVSQGHVNLYSKDAPKAIAELYADANFFAKMKQQIADQRATIAVEEEARRNWLGWVGWTASLVPTVKGDQLELEYLVTLDKHLTLAVQRIEPAPDSSHVLPSVDGAVELFVGCALLSSGEVALYSPAGPGLHDPARLRANDPLGPVVVDVAQKLKKELAADIQASEHDLKQSQSDLVSMNQDLSEYQSLQGQNDASYEVDYGTDSIPVSDAIAKTNTDISATQSDIQTLQSDISKMKADLDRIQTVLDSLKR